MRARMHGRWPVSPCTHYKSTASCLGSSSCSPGNYDGLVTDGEIFSCLSPSRGLNQRASQTALGGTSTLHWAAMQSFIWKRLCQALVLFLEATVGHAGLWLDMEYHAVNHRELQDNRSGRFRLEPDWLHNILIPVSSDNGSKNGSRKLLSTLKSFFFFFFGT